MYTRLWSTSFCCGYVVSALWILATLVPYSAGPCITNVIATCRKNFSQWHRSFQRKLRSHWLKFLRHVAITLVIQGPGLLHWHWAKRVIDPVPMKWPWNILSKSRHNSVYPSWHKLQIPCTSYDICIFYVRNQENVEYMNQPCHSLWDIPLST